MGTVPNRTTSPPGATQIMPAGNEALDELARQKWAESRERAAAAEARSREAAARAQVAAAAFAGYGSGSDNEGRDPASAFADYGSDSDNGESGDMGTGGSSNSASDVKVVESDLPIQSTDKAPRSPSRLPRAESGGRAGAHEEGCATLALTSRCASNSCMLGELEPEQALKKRKTLPASRDALTSAVPAVEDLLALQPREPTKEEQRAELNAEQARRIEELFFW